jgi:hypothetical protein
MASCLVDIRNEVTNKIRLMNPFDYEIQVNQNTVVGEAFMRHDNPGKALQDIFGVNK